MKCGLLILKRAELPIETAVSKFGGSPGWVEEPAWPRSRSTGEPMLFIGQIVVDPLLFPIAPGRIAYIFITRENDGSIETWAPDAGESAVVIQQASSERKFALSEGPRLAETYWEGGTRRERPLELAASFDYQDESENPSYDEVVRFWERDRQIEHVLRWAQKVGGTPEWIQADEAPEGWGLLAQFGDGFWLDGRCIETNLNFGAGRCYVLISPDCAQGKLIWQC